MTDLSINQIILQGRSNPGEVSNWALLLENGKFYNRSAAKDEAHFSPLREGMMEGREFFIVPRSVPRPRNKKILYREESDRSALSQRSSSFSPHLSNAQR